MLFPPVVLVFHQNTRNKVVRIVSVPGAGDMRMIQYNFSVLLLSIGYNPSQKKRPYDPYQPHHRTIIMSSDSTSLNARASENYAPVPPAQIDAQTAAATTTTTNIEDPPTDEYVPVPPALVAEQTAAAYDEMDAAIKETVAESLRTDPPIPPAQTAAAYDDMENVLKTSVEDNENDDDAPLPRYYDPDDFNYLASPAAQYQKPRAKTGIDNSQGVDAPIPPGLDDDDENQNQKPRARRGANENDDAARMAPATPTSGNGGEATALPAIHHERPLSSPPIPPPQSTPPPATPTSGNGGEATALPAIHHERPSSAPPELEVTIPPPQSTPPPDGDEENTLPPPTLEATLVQSAEAILIDPNQSNASPNTGPVYMATQINSTGSPWWKRYKNYFLVALISVMATAIVMLVITVVNGNEVDTQPITTPPQDTQPIKQPPLTTTPPTSMLNSTILSPVRIQSRAMQILFAPFFLRM
jgi:hypothetical protein